MFKKTFLILFFSLIISGLLFANNDDQDKNMPRHTISIDALTTTVSLLSLPILNQSYVIDSYILMTAIQYEFQVNDKLGLAARFGVKHFKLEFEMTSLSAEGHIRFYPAGSAFYLGGLIGWANFTASNMPNFNFITFGPRLGWRIDFGKPGGFIIEPSLGYTGALGDPDFSKYLEKEDMGGATGFLIQQYVVGGFSINFAMGLRF